MQKIKNPILCWIVIFAVFIRPIPAQAVLPALGLALIEEAAIGAAVATGVEFASAAYDYYKSGGAPVQDYYAPTAGMKYADSYNASGSTATVNTTKKTITRPVQAIKTFPPSTPTGKSYHFGKQTAIGVGVAALTGWIATHPTSAPVTKQAIDNSSSPIPLPAPLPGDIYNNAGHKKITSVGAITTPGNFYTEANQSFCDGMKVYYPLWIDIGGCRLVNNTNTAMVFNPRADPSGYVNPNNGRKLSDSDYAPIVTINTLDPLSPIPQLSLDIQKLADAIAGLSGVVGELDSAIRDNLNPGFVDVPKLTQSEIDQAASQTAQLQAQDHADNLKAQADADPTNIDKQLAAEEAQREADRRKLDYERQFDNLDDQDPQEPEPDIVPPPPGPEPDPDLEIDLTPLLSLKDKAMGKFPFSAVSSLGSIFSGLTADPVTPSMDMPMPWGLPSAKISLSKWDDFAVKWRFLIAMMFHASCIYAIVRRYA